MMPYTVNSSTVNSSTVNSSTKPPSIRTVETRAKRAMRIARGMGMKFRQGSILNIEGKTCCVLGACALAENPHAGYTNSYGRAYEFLGLTRTQGDNIASGFDGSGFKKNVPTGLRPYYNLGARLFKYGKTCRAEHVTGKKAA